MSTTEKQTAVEWLIEQIENQRETGNTDLRTTLHFCDKAKEIEKQNIINAYESGGVDGQIFALTRKINIENAEQYYNDTFNK
jgi:hypothetical protein